MKKITLLFLLTALPFLGFSQTTIDTYDFDSDNEGFVDGSSMVSSQVTTDNFLGAGSLKAIASANFKVVKKNWSLDGTGEYTLKFNIKGGTDGVSKVKAIMNQGTSISGSSIVINSMTSAIGTDTDTWYEYSYTFAITSLISPQIQIQMSLAGTYYIDNVTIVKEACVGYAIQATTDGGGTNIITTELACYAEGEEVEFTATACTDFTFDHWELDGVTVGDATTSYTHTVADEDATVKAFFTGNSPAADTKYDTTVELERWSASSNGSVSAVSNDLIWTISGNNPKIILDCALAVETWDLTALRIGYTNATSNTRLRLVHAKDGGTEYINYDGMAVEGDATSGVGTLELALGHATWIGNVSDIQLFIKLNNSNGNADTGDFTIDYIEFFEAPTAGLNDLNENEGISIYPNPVKEILNISSEVSQIEIFNVLGQKVISLSNVNSLDTSNFKGGSYFAKITTSEGVTTTKRFFK